MCGSGAVVCSNPLYCFVIVRLGRRGLVWINVTTNQTAEWIAHQLTEAFPWNEAPRYLIRDRDRIYAAAVIRRNRSIGIRDKPIAPASPWQNGFAERLIGSIRRECVDHFVVLGEAHLRRIASLCRLLQRRQNAPVIGQRSAGLSPCSAGWNHNFTLYPWRASSLLCPDLGFRYTQPAAGAKFGAPPQGFARSFLFECQVRRFDDTDIFRDVGIDALAERFARAAAWVDAHRLELVLHF